MVAFRYGEWAYICQHSPQAICNLFFRQLLVHPEHGVRAAPDAHLALPADEDARNDFLASAGMGIQPVCTITRMGHNGSAGNVANIIACCFAFLVTLQLYRMGVRRRAAVGRIEMMMILGVYALTTIFQLLDSGAILRQGSKALVWLTAMHAALGVVFFGLLVWLGFLGLQLVEDGTTGSLLPACGGGLLLLVGAAYIFLDTGFGISHYMASQPAGHLYSPWTFTLTILWPLVALTLFGGLTTLVAARVLREGRPILLLFGSLVVLVVAEVARWVLNQPLCRASHGAIDGGFLGTVLETGALCGLYAVWSSLTEDEWDEFQGLRNSSAHQHAGQGVLPTRNSAGSPVGKEMAYELDRPGFQHQQVYDQQQHQQQQEHQYEQHYQQQQQQEDYDHHQH